MARIFSIIIFLVILVLGITFALQNSALVSIHYYIGADQLPLSLLLVLVLGMGTIIGWSTGLWMWCKLKAENLKLAHRLKMAEKELHQLRIQPIHEV